MNLLYTDGISEAPNSAGQLYGTNRLCQHAQTGNGDLELRQNDHGR